MDNSKARIASVSEDNFTVALNIGKNAGIQEGDTYLIYSYSDEPIIDPETKEVLGKLEIVKGKGRVVNVQDKLCSVRSIEKNYVKKPALENNMFHPLYRQRVLTYDDIEEMPFEDPKVGDYAKKI